MGTEKKSDTPIKSMNRNISRESVTTDDGYSSDTKSPSKSSYETENREFKDKYLVEKLLNNSANGVIYTGTRKSDMMPVVVKQIPKSRITSHINDLPPEIYFHLKSTGVKGVCSLLDWYERRTSWVLILSRNSRSIDLFELSAKYGALGEEAARVIIRQVVESSLQLQKRGVFHRDIKDENIMVDTMTLETQLIDFGCATHHSDSESYTELMGTPEFFPPEYYTTQHYSAETSTSWTLGILLYVLLIGDIPFDTQQSIVNGQRKKHDESKMSRPARHLLSKLLSAKPSSRPQLHEILSSEWMVRN